MLSVNGYHKDGCRQQGCFVGLNTCLHILGYLLLPLLQPFCTCMCVSAFKPLHPNSKKNNIFHSTFMERGPDKEKGVKSSFCCFLAVVYSIDTMSERKKKSPSKPTPNSCVCWPDYCLTFLAMGCLHIFQLGTLRFILTLLPCIILLF